MGLSFLPRSKKESLKHHAVSRAKGAGAGAGPFFI